MITKQEMDAALTLAGHIVARMLAAYPKEINALLYHPGNRADPATLKLLRSRISSNLWIDGAGEPSPNAADLDVE